MNAARSAILTLGGIYMIWAHGTDIRFIATGVVLALAGVLIYKPDEE